MVAKYLPRNTIGGQFSDTKIAFVPCLRAHVKGCYRSTNEEFYSRWVASAAHCMSLSNPPLPANQVSAKHKQKLALSSAVSNLFYSGRVPESDTCRGGSAQLPQHRHGPHRHLRRGQDRGAQGQAGPPQHGGQGSHQGEKFIRPSAPHTNLSART